MTDKSPQPVEATDEAGLDLEQELNDLLGHIQSANATAAGSSAKTPKPAGDVEGDELDRQIDRVISGAQDDAAYDPAESDDAEDDEDTLLPGDYDTAENTIRQSDDPLADQIQELLDEAKSMSASSADHGGALPEAAETGDLGELDQMLADSAEQAVGGAFESFDEVMGTAATDRGNQTPGREETDDLPIDADDAFASPEQVLDETEPETDEHVDKHFVAAAEPARKPDAPVATAQAHHPSSESPPHADSEEPDTPGKHARDLTAVIRLQGDRFRRGCARVNRPLAQFPPEVRNTIGYIGLATAANAVILILYGIVF